MTTKKAHDELKAEFAKLGLDYPPYADIYSCEALEAPIAEAAMSFGECLVKLLRCEDVKDVVVAVCEKLKIPEELLREVYPSPEVIRMDTDEAKGNLIGEFRDKIVKAVSMIHGPRFAALFEAIAIFCLAFGCRIGVLLAVRQNILEAGRRAGILSRDFQNLVGRLGAVSAHKEAELLISDFARWLKSECASPLAFVSYQTLDERVANEVVELVEQSGMRGFLANRELLAHQELEEELRGALMRSAVVLIIVTPHALQSHWVRMEIGAAWILRKEIIALLVSVRSSELPDYARKFQAQLFETKTDRQTLLEALRRKS